MRRRQLEVIDFKEKNMKDRAVIIAPIMVIALIIPAPVLLSGLRSFGRGIEKAGTSIRSGLAAVSVGRATRSIWALEAVEDKSEGRHEVTFTNSTGTRVRYHGRGRSIAPCA
jgi:hypothetical protein